MVLSIPSPSLSCCEQCQSCLSQLASWIQAVTYEEGEGLLELAHLLLGQ